MLRSPEEVKDFVNKASICPFEIDLQSGNVFIDAKSFLGVLTMAMHRRMEVVCIDPQEGRPLTELKKFAVA